MHNTMQKQMNEQLFASTMASSSNVIPRPEKKAKVDTTTPTLPNWLDLPRDITATIFHKLGPIEILNSAQRVCPLWRKISKDPLVWRTIDMNNCASPHAINCDLMKMCCHAIDRSCGQLQDIDVENFGNDSLLKYIADSTSQVRRMRLAYCLAISSPGVTYGAKKLPLLEELEISYIDLSKDALEAIGQCCPLLKVLKFYNKEKYSIRRFRCDDEAFAIAKTMPNLRHLQLLGNSLTNAGLLAILDGCPHLESLDLRDCFNVDLRAGLGKRCAEQIKEFQFGYLEEFSDDDYDDDDDDDDPYADLYCDSGITESDDEEAFASKAADYLGIL